METALQAARAIKIAGQPRAYVLDDTIEVRYGKKMPWVSSHFDHTLGRCVMGQQVLTLGLSCSTGFVPIDSELFISQTRTRCRHARENAGWQT